MLMVKTSTNVQHVVHKSFKAWEDYDIVQIDAMNETTEFMDFKIKYKRINKTTYGLTGSVQVADLAGIEVKHSLNLYIEHIVLMCCIVHVFSLNCSSITMPRATINLC